MAGLTGRKKCLPWYYESGKHNTVKSSCLRLHVVNLFRYLTIFWTIYICKAFVKKLVNVKEIKFFFFYLAN